MRKAILLLALALMTVAAALAVTPSASDKLPKCSMTLCRSVGCSADVLCVQGAHVRNCADVCSNGQ